MNQTHARTVQPEVLDRRLADGRQAAYQLCPTPIGHCRESVFNISLYDDKEQKPIGAIYKVWSDLYSQCCSTAA